MTVVCKYNLHIIIQSLNILNRKEAKEKQKKKEEKKEEKSVRHM